MLKVRTIPLIKWLALAMVAFITFGALFIYQEDTGLSVEANTNESDSVTLAMLLPTAYNDYVASKSRGRGSVEADEEVKDLIREHYGNVGLLIGPRDSSGFSSSIGALLHPNSISLAPNDLKAMGFFEDSETRDNLKSYAVFGRAIQELSDRGSGLLSSTAGAQDSLDVVANTATGISRAGMKILIDYSPGPLIKQMYTGERATAVADSNFVEADGTVMAPGHKLVSMLEGNVMGEIWEALSIKPLGEDVPVTLTTLILAIIIVLTAVGGIIMTLSGGRGGESIKKIAVRIVVASVAIPLAGMILHWGLVGAAAVTDYDMSQEERDARLQIGRHLNLAGWAETGFRVPDGMTLEIKNGRFSLTQSQIRTLNVQSYFYKRYGPDLASSLSTEFFESVLDDPDKYFNATEIYEDMKETAKDHMNNTKPHFSLRSDGNAIEIVRKAKTIGSAKWSIKDENVDEDKMFSYIDSANFVNKMKQDTKGDYTVTSDDNKSGMYGMSPIAAYHIFFTDFTGNAIKANQNARPYTTVVFHASNGQAGTNADGSEAKTGMGGFIKLVAIFTVSIASLKGLGQIIMSGFGGLIAGTARSSVGSSAGFGQAVGGVLALVLGVIGMSFIIHISFELLDALYDIISYLFRDADGADVMQPVAESIKDGLPKGLKWLFGWLATPLANLGSFIISIIAILALPKFGKIPIEMFSAKMAELPGNMADRAQQMENRFTGDFRGGGGGFGGGGGSRLGSSVGAALKSGVGSAKGLGQAALAGAGIGAGLAGMGISKLADKLSKGSDKSESLSSLGDTDDNPDDPPITDDPNNPPVGEQQSPDETPTERPTNETAPNEKTVEQENADTTISETDAMNEQDGADQLKEVDQENETLQDGGETIQDSETLGGEVQTEHVQNTDQEQSMDKEVASEHTAGANDSVSQENSEVSKEGGDHSTTQEGGTSETSKESVQQSNHEQSMDSQNTSDMSSMSDNQSLSDKQVESNTSEKSDTQNTNTSSTTDGSSNDNVGESPTESSVSGDGTTPTSTPTDGSKGADATSSGDTSLNVDGEPKPTPTNANQSVSDNQSLSDKQVESNTSEKSDAQSTNTSSTADGSSNDSVGESPTGESVSGDGTTPTSTSTDGSKGAGATSSGDTSLNVDGGPKPTPTNANQNMNVRNENKTANQTNNEAMTSSNIGGDTHIDGAGESLGLATDGGGTPPGGPSGPPPGGPGGPDKTGGKQNNAPQTKAQKMANAMKRVMTKDNGIKALGAVGKGLQAAGGKVSAKRISAAVLHAAVSASGLQDTFNTKAVLDKASGKVPQQRTQQDQKQDQKDNKQQNRRQTQAMNEQMLYYIKQQQENDRRPPRK